jgi:hypothetical protein
MANDKSQLSAMSDRARLLAKGEFDREVLSERFVDVLEAVAKP